MALGDRKMVLVSRDNNGNEMRTTLPFEIPSDTSYEVIDQASRNLMALSTNSYVDTELTQTISLKDVLS